MHSCNKLLQNCLFSRERRCSFRCADVAGDVAARPVDEIRSTGFVRHTFDAALWCLVNTSSYAECALAAVNLGDDTDTTAAVAGALTGIVYGVEGIPDEWLNRLRGKDVIEACLF